MPIDDDDALREAARAVARAGLSDAFGHLSVRRASRSLLITPARPLGQLSADDDCVEVPLEASGLPDRAPREAWIHVALYSARLQIGAICRAQPPAVAATTALARELTVLFGHAALLGPVAVHDDSRLVRDAAGGSALARSVGDADVVTLRGNGAVTVGVDLAQAVARMWVLEKTAALNLRAWAAGRPVDLPADEQQWWRARSAELLPRIFDYLRHPGKDLHD